MVAAAYDYRHDASVADQVAVLVGRSRAVLADCNSSALPWPTGRDDKAPIAAPIVEQSIAYRAIGDIAGRLRLLVILCCCREARGHGWLLVL